MEESEKILGKLAFEEKARLTIGKNCWQTVSYPEKGLGTVTFCDGPNGVRKEKETNDPMGLSKSYAATAFPSLTNLASTWDSEMAYLYGKTLGEEARDFRNNVILGPGLNIKRNPLCGRNFEYLSEDPYLAGKTAASYIKGVQENGISACVKHYCLNSQETRRMTMDSVVDERTLREIYLTGFEIAIKEGKPGAVMSSYNLINGKYATENPHTLVEILRDNFKFDGVVVSDWGAENNRADGLRCYNAVEMPAPSESECEDFIKEAEKNRDLEKYLDADCRQIIDLYLKTKDAVPEEFVPFDKKKHHEIAKTIAENSMVLLKNGNSVLPLKKEDKVSFGGDFLFHPRYQGGGSSNVNPALMEDYAELIKKDKGYAFVSLFQGFDRFGNEKDDSLLHDALEKTKGADTVVLFAGLDEKSEIEGQDRKDMKIRDNQHRLFAELKKTGKKIIVVLYGGSPMELGNFLEADALLLAYLPGQAGGSALLDVITGRTVPSGKLAESFPLQYEDVPCSSYYPGKELAAFYKEALFVGYRYYKTKGIKVAYPFGYGLSYTSFEYSDLKVNEDGVSFTLKNIGKFKGKEVAELYVHKDSDYIFRPEEELKGFKKIGLEPGEEKRVRIPFDEYTFRYFNVKTDKFEVEEGNYRIRIGASSEDIRLEGAIELKGTSSLHPYIKEKIPSYYKGEVKDVSNQEFEELCQRKLPEAYIRRNKKGRVLNLTDLCTIGELKNARSFWGRLIYRILLHHLEKMTEGKEMEAKVTIMQSALNAPFHSAARLSGGIVTSYQMQGIIDLANGKFFKGAYKILRKHR